MAPQIHPTADVESGVEIGDGTSVWAYVHIRGPGTRVGRNCIVGEQTYIGPEVTVGDLVKLNAMVYVPMGVTLERGVMVSAGTVFTNDRYPRATDAPLHVLRTSGPGDHVLATVVREGASIGANCTIAAGIEIGRFAMVGMGAVVTRDVAPFHLVAGNPAKPIGLVCRCGAPLLRFATESVPTEVAGDCAACGRRYDVVAGRVTEVLPEEPA